MDLDKLIKNSLDAYAENIVIDIPSYDEIWEKSQVKNKIPPKKRFKINLYSTSGWLEVAMFLLIIILIPILVTHIGSFSSKISPSSKQEVTLNNNDIENAKKVAISFLTEFTNYSNYHTFDNISILYPNDERTKKFLSYLTERYSNDFLATRAALVIPRSAYNLKCEVKLDSLIINNDLPNSKDNQPVFYYTVKANYIKDGNLTDITSIKFEGRLRLINEKNTWKIDENSVQSIEPKDWFKNDTVKLH
ncbi:hypothetical protein [Candidatus Clostridium stratigraminis]|uniref:Conjugative transposon protein TcpC n=1 Tax=Candidatus Clostridium stratigraminis TaxID=3381661 RepID=A0ABW8T5L7_9CLOT